MFTTLLLAAVSALTLAKPNMHQHHKHAPNTSINRRQSDGPFQGPATWYQGNLAGGACRFTQYTLPAGVYGTALAVSNWDGSYNCGGCVHITNRLGKTITAMIVDECMTCAQNGLDLFPDALEQINDAGPDGTTWGNFPVTWTYAECPPLGNLRIHLESGASQYWFSAQVTNAVRRTASMEVSRDGGATWIPTIRQDYNYFKIDAGAGPGPVQVRVTSHMGSVVTVQNVAVGGDAVTEGSSNYE